MPEWLQSEWIAVVAPIVGSFLAAWWGARLAFRKTLREKALTGTIEWYEDAIRNIANYEEVLSHVRDDRVAAALTAGEPDKPLEPTRERWEELVEAEARLRRALQLFEVYTRGNTRTQCSVALSHTATLAKGQWLKLGSVPVLTIGDIVKGQSVRTLRLSLEAELRRVLQVDGWIRSRWPWLNKKVFLWSLARQRKGLKRASAEERPSHARRKRTKPMS